MIKHIVFWRLKESAHGNGKLANARLIKEKIEGLRGRIPGLLTIELGIETTATENSGDIVLYSEFSSQEALNAYLVHPEHKAIIPFVVEAQCERRTVDYEA